MKFGDVRKVKIMNESDSDEEDHDIRSFEVRSWVIFSYPGKKNNMKYIGKIVQVLTRLKCLDIKFVRKQPALSQFMFSNKPDDDDHAVSYHALLQILSDPIKNNREQYSFSGLKHKVSN